MRILLKKINLLMFFKKRLPSILPIFIVLFLVLIAYLPILSSFFQQDEWLAFSNHLLLENKDLVSIIKAAFAPSVGHYQPLNILFINTLFSLFHLNFLFYAIVSIGLHLLCVTLVFYLADEVFENWKVAALSSLLFGVTASSFQATSWVLADIGIHMSTIFSLLSLIFILKFSKSNKLKFFFFSTFLVIVSLLFKESVLGMFFLIPIAYLLFANKKFNPQKKYLLQSKKLILFMVFLVCLIYLLFRLSMILLPQSYARDELVTNSQPLRYLVYNIATFPFKAISQSIIPSAVTLNASYLIADLVPYKFPFEKNTTEYDQFVQKNIFEIVSFLLSLVMLFIAFKAWNKGKENFSKIIIFSVLFILLNAPIFAFTPEKIGRIFIIDSRNLYFISVGSSLLIVSSLLFFTKKHVVKFSIICFLLVIVNIYLLNQQLTEIAKSGIIRRTILDQIKKQNPLLPERVIFYTESNKSYYGLPETERILPFQSGFGQTLLIWYFPSSRLSSHFLENRFLWEINSQGYKEIDNQGFGYFRDFDLLKKAIKEYNIPANSIIAYSWNGRLNTLTQVSEQVREKLYK